MTRIQVFPDELRQAGRVVSGSMGELERLTGRARSALAALPWEISGRAAVDRWYEQAMGLARQLTEQGWQMARYLGQKADQFDEANLAPLPTMAGGAPARTAPPPAASPPPPPPISSPPPPGANTDEHVMAMLAQYFPQPEDRQIILHTMAAEGPGRFGASWGGVVYRERESGQLMADRQMLNFGLISFAFPAGSAGTVMRQILASPEEEAALREIALRHLQDCPGGEIPEGWRHLLRTTDDPGYPPRSKEQLVDEFIGQIRAHNDQQAADWLFKYANTPTTESGVASTDLRADWQGVFREWLARPAGQVAQLVVARDQYFTGSDRIAEKLGLSSVRGVAFVFDTRVQGGSIPDSFWAKAATADYQAASESDKLAMLRDCFAPGSTEWTRRHAVITSGTLTDAPYSMARTGGA